MLAAVEHQQRLAVSQEGDDAGRGIALTDRQSERRGHGTGHGVRVGQRSEIDKTDLVRETTRDVVRHGGGERGFADAPRSHDVHEAMLMQQLGELRQLMLAADHAREAWRQRRCGERDVR
ncbi:MAG: hypothetical protein RLZZ450_3685 [Pseudomonadota bacterium]